MTFYLDASVLVRALTNEAGTAKTQAWLATEAAANGLISDWVVTEFSSALSIRLRTGRTGPLDRAAALAMFARLTAESFGMLTVNPNQFRTAARFADQYRLGLRAGDSLHLAICADHGATLCTLDRRLAEAGPVLGVPTLML